MMPRPLSTEAVARGRRSRRWPAVLALSLVCGVSAGVIAYGDRLSLSDIGRTLSNVRDTSLDAALEARTRSALSLSRRVSGMRFEVEARSGVVTLSGRVPTQEARSIIEAIAADTPGVSEVQNHLVVDARATATGYEQTLLQRIADLETHVAVQERLRREPLLARSGVRVDVERGVVVLRGEAESEVQRASAQEIAEAAVGAEHVRNEVRAPSPAGNGEELLTQRIEFELYSSAAFDLPRIQVSTEGGRATLRGAVRSRAERLLAERLVERVPGVLEVVNELTYERAS